MPGNPSVASSEVTPLFHGEDKDPGGSTNPLDALQIP